jgi:hypothetical protein
MGKELYFHDGNFASFAISEFSQTPVCEIALDLYKAPNTQHRSRCVITIANPTRISLVGDFLEIKKNHFAGVIEDGGIHQYGDSQRLILRITGGYLEIFGQISFSFKD